jgi:hypothetical protein
MHCERGKPGVSHLLDLSKQTVMVHSELIHIQVDGVLFCEMNMARWLTYAVVEGGQIHLFLSETRDEDIYNHERPSVAEGPAQLS